MQQSNSESLTQGRSTRGKASLSEQNQIVEALVTINQNQKALMNEVQHQAQSNQQIMTLVQSLRREFEQYKSENNNLKLKKNSENSNELNNKINELSKNVDGLSKLVLESKTVVNAEGKTVLASDEVLRNDVEHLRNNVATMIDAVKKQRMTLNLDAQKVADNLANRLETPTTQAIEKSIVLTAKKVERYNDVTQKQSQEIRKQMKETKADVKDLVYWLKPAVTGISIVLGMLLIALVTLSYGGQIVDNLVNWVGLRGAIINAYHHFFATTGWGYIGWFLALIFFVAIEVGVLFGFGYGIFKLMKYTIDKLH